MPEIPNDLSRGRKVSLGVAILLMCLIASAAVGFGVVAYERQGDRDRQAAAVSAAVAAAAPIAAAQAQETADAAAKKREIAQYKQLISACGRNNALRDYMRLLRAGVSDIATDIADGRKVQAKLEPTRELELHDLAIAKKYEMDAAALVKIPSVDCAKKFPDPFPTGQSHR